MASAFRAHATRPALIEADGTVWSYARAEQAVERIADRLRRAGVGPGDALLLQGRTCLPAVLCCWAAWRLGALPAPVDPAWPDYLLAQVLEQVRPQLLLRMDGVAAGGWPSAPVIADAQGRPSALFLDWLGTEAEAGPPAAEGLDADATAGAILFTSGSTGQPKGVVISRGALARSGELAAETFGWREDDRFLNLSDLHTMSGLRNTCLAAAARGAAVLLPAPADRGNLFAIQDCLRLHRATFLGAGPALVAMVLQVRERLQPEPWRALRGLLCTGGALQPEAARAFQAWAGTPVLDYYGLTETAGLCIAHRADGADCGDGTLGRPVGAVCRILGPDGLERFAGEPGELVVAGPNLMLGYLGRPDLTAAVLADGCFHTGDQARILPDGRVQLLGRIRHCIKTASGDLLFPEEIEVALGGHPGLLDAAAVALHGEGGGDRMIVCLVPRAGLAEPQRLPRELHRFLLERLGVGRLPNGYRLVARIPRLATGKIDRRTLQKEFHGNA